MQMTRVKNSFGFRADQYANKKDACAAARSGKDIIVGAVEDNEPNERNEPSSSSSSVNAGRQVRFANGPDHLRAPVVSVEEPVVAVGV
jgi:hypothetical protein